MNKMYLDKKTFLKHINESRSNGYVTNELAKDFIMLIDNIQKSKFFNKYRKDILDDMKGECLYVMVKKFEKFDPNKNTSPFSYFTRLVFNTSYNVYKKMKRNWDLQNKVTNMTIENMKNEGLYIARTTNGRQ